MRNKGKVALLTLLLLFLPLSRLVAAQTPLQTEATSTPQAPTIAPTPPVVPPKEQSTDPKVEKVKQQINKRISNKKSRVRIRLHTGQELKGRIDEAGPERFTITEDKSGRKTELAYVDVNKVSGRGMSMAAKVLIVVGAVVVVVAILGIIAVKSIDPFEHGILL